MSTLSIVVWCTAVFAAPLWAQVAREANESFRDQTTRSQTVQGMNSQSRDARQKPKELVAALQLKPGMTVADVGTGGGYMLPYLGDAVGPTGKVYAQDIFSDVLETAKKHAAGRSNVEYVLGSAKNPQLPAGTMDVVFVLDAYHHFDYPKETVSGLKKALKPGGRLIVVEYHKNEKSMPNRRALTHIRATQDEFVKEIEDFGFRVLSVSDFLPEVQWLGVFESR